MSKNQYYHRCKYLKMVFVDRGLHSYVKNVCTLFGVNLNQKGIETMCCISNSPYMDKNCKYFKDKSGTIQTVLFEKEKLE